MRSILYAVENANKNAYNWEENPPFGILTSGRTESIKGMISIHDLQKTHLWTYSECLEEISDHKGSILNIVEIEKNTICSADDKRVLKIWKYK